MVVMCRHVGSQVKVSVKCTRTKARETRDNGGRLVLYAGDMRRTGECSSLYISFCLTINMYFLASAYPTFVSTKSVLYLEIWRLY